jgi:general secretion pathway protein F
VAGRALRLPVVGALLYKYELTLFSRSLGTLLGNGVPLLTALHIATETVGNVNCASRWPRWRPRSRKAGAWCNAMESHRRV